MRLKIKIDIKRVLGYIFTTLLTSVILTLLFVALPLTERLSGKVSFDFNIKDSRYWSKEYTIDIASEDQSVVSIVRDVIYRRLNSFGVEDISFYKAENREGVSTLRLVVNTVREEEFVKQLIENRFDVKIMTKREEVNFEDESNPYAYLLPKSYIDTEWNFQDFRNVYITKLRNNNGEDSYFAIFKLWPWREAAFRSFLKDNGGKYLGVYTGGYVSPVMMPLDDASQGMLAVPVNTESQEQVRVLSLLYNSGDIPVDYKISTENSLTPQNIIVDYVRVAIGLLIAVTVSYLYILIFRNGSKDILFRSFFATLLTLIIYIAGLKFFSIPVDTFVLPLVGILTTIFIRFISENNDSQFYLEGAITLVLICFIIFGDWYIADIAKHLLFTVVISKLVLMFSSWYISKVKGI